MRSCWSRSWRREDRARFRQTFVQTFLCRINRTKIGRLCLAIVPTVFQYASGQQTSTDVLSSSCFPAVRLGRSAQTRHRKHPHPLCHLWFGHMWPWWSCPSISSDCKVPVGCCWRLWDHRNSHGGSETTGMPPRQQIKTRKHQTLTWGKHHGTPEVPKVTSCFHLCRNLHSWLCTPLRQMPYGSLRYVHTRKRNFNSH